MFALRLRCKISPDGEQNRPKGDGSLRGITPKNQLT
jgi:hypothetical protein